MAPSALGRIDEIIHGRLRLGIMVYLSEAEAADFTELKTALEATQGNLSVHLRKLQDAGYVEIEKSFLNLKPLTRIRITRPDGGKPAPLRLILGRYGVGQVLASIPVVGGLYGLADCAFIFRQSRRCIHDLIADTIVVKA